MNSDRVSVKLDSSMDPSDIAVRVHYDMDGRTYWTVILNINVCYYVLKKTLLPDLAGEVSEKLVLLRALTLSIEDRVAVESLYGD